MIPTHYESRIGKYSSNVEAALHEMAMDADGFGDVESFGYFSLVVFDAEERAALLRVDYGGSAAALMEEDSQGFVHFRFFATEEEARAVYDSLEAEWVEEEEAAAREAGDGWSPADAFKAGE